MLFISYCFRERTYNIQTTLSKRPRAGKRIENSSRLVNVWRESLTLITFPNIFLCFLLHAWPPVSLSNSPMGQRSSSYVTPTNTFMQLFQEWFWCVRMYTKADKDQKTNAYTIFYLRTAKTEELSFVFFQFRTSPQAIYLFQGTAI